MDDISKCMINNKCIEIPKQVEQPVPLSIIPFFEKDFVGTYWIVKGVDPSHDCFRCQSLDFSNDGKVLVTIKPFPDAEDTISVNANVKSGRLGHLLMTSTFSGIESKKEFFVLSSMNGFLLVYYTGFSLIDGNWNSLVVFSRDRNSLMTDDIKSQFETAIKVSGLKFEASLDGFCSREDNSKC